MEIEFYPVPMYCPIRNAEDTVYFQVIETDGKLCLRLDDFNGCEHEWHACQECDDCKNEAFKKVPGMIERLRNE